MDRAVSAISSTGRDDGRIGGRVVGGDWERGVGDVSGRRVVMEVGRRGGRFCIAGLWASKIMAWDLDIEGPHGKNSTRTRERQQHETPGE